MFIISGSYRHVKTAGNLGVCTCHRYIFGQKGQKSELNTVFINICLSLGCIHTKSGVEKTTRLCHKSSGDLT